MQKPVDKLRIEQSQNHSGELLNNGKIILLKSADYQIHDIQMDGNNPKQFIKVYQFNRDSLIRRQKSDTWTPYIAKTADKWYPHESVIEFMINKIGHSLKLNVNEVRLLKINGQIRFLSKYFLNENESLVHGAEILGEYLQDSDMARDIANDKGLAMQLFNFEFIQEALKKVYKSNYKVLIEELVKMLTFDALSGNNDRHYYNWGIIDTKKESAKLPRFAPIYDSSRGLLWNISDTTIKTWLKQQQSNGKQVINYIEKASPRVCIEGKSNITHFELMHFLKSESHDFKSIINSLAREENQERVVEMLNRDFFPYFVDDRKELTAHIVNCRFTRIREL